MELKDLEGKHVLTGVDFGKLKNKDYSYDESTTVDFILDGKIFSAIEDPNDGYRSCMSEIIENREGADIKNIFYAVVVCGVMRNDSIYEVNEIIDFVDMTKNKAVDVRFIELMPIGIAVNYKGVTNEEILATIKEHYKEVIEVKRSKMGGPATYVKLNEAKGKIGFISAMSNCFCEDCNRIRLTPEGFLKQCLHFDYGVDLRKLMRDGISDEELKKVIYHNIYDKPEKHLFLEKCEHKEIKFMNQIGG